MPKANNEHLTKLFLLYVICQFVLHAYFTLVVIDVGLFLPTAIAFLYDISILGTVTAMGYLIMMALPPRWEKATEIVFSILIIAIGVSLASYPRVLREYLEYPVNIFNSDMSSARVFISDYLGLSAFIPSLLALILGLTVLFLRVKWEIPQKVKLIGIVVVGAIFSITLQSSSPQPFVYSIQKEFNGLVTQNPRIVSSLVKPTETPEKQGKPAILQYSSKAMSNYDHILLIVMEGVNANEFEKEFLTIRNGYFEQNKDHAVYFRNLYTSNLDSYTSLISMLTTIQVPYRAYGDERLYKRVNTAPSLNQDLQTRGFHTVFLSTYEYQPFVPTRNCWSGIYERKDLPSITGWLSLESSRMESATEDKAAIPKILDILNKNPRSFLLHELVYGHSTEWKALTGKSKSVYYDEFLKDLATGIKDVGLLDRSLILVIADHGSRARSSDPESYRIPLLVVGNKNSSEICEELLSTRDLSDLIYHFGASEQFPKARVEVTLVGSTDNWVYGKLNHQKQFLFIDDASGTILSSEGDFDPVQFRNEFQQKLEDFHRHFGPEFDPNVKGRILGN